MAWPTKYTDEQREKAKELHNKRYTYKEISKITGINKRTINKIVNIKPTTTVNHHMITDNTTINVKYIDSMGSDFKLIKVSKHLSKRRFVDYIILEWLKARGNHGKQCRNNI